MVIQGVLAQLRFLVGCFNYIEIPFIHMISAIFSTFTTSLIRIVNTLTFTVVF